jgi:hypothetical protein
MHGIICLSVIGCCLKSNISSIELLEDIDRPFTSDAIFIIYFILVLLYVQHLLYWHAYWFMMIEVCNS